MTKPDEFAAMTSPGRALAEDIVDRIDNLLQSAQASGQPIEIDPQRSSLFELFVMSEATGFLEEGAQEDLSCDGIARALADRWKLARNLGGSLSPASAMPTEQLSRLKLLWSFMRMWMEWTYAWQRWEEFHNPTSPSRTPARK
jgi:hypothetical protein